MSTPKTNGRPRTPGNRILGKGYAHALAVIYAQPCTWHDLAEKVNLARASAQRILHGFRRQNRAHISGWVRIKSGRRSQLTPQYSYGPGDDVPCPISMRESAKPTPFELLAFCRLLDALEADSWHFAGLSQHLGMSKRTVAAIVQTLRKHKLVYIDDYLHRPRGGSRPPLWAYGPGVRDAPRPAKVTMQAVNAEASARRKHAKLLRCIVSAQPLDLRRSVAQEVGDRREEAA